MTTGTGFIGVGSFGALTDAQIQDLTTANGINSSFDFSSIY